MVTGELLIGEVHDHAVIILDDLISTGTRCSAGPAAAGRPEQRGFSQPRPDGLLVGRLLADPLFESVAMTDTVRPVATAEGRLPESVVCLDSTQLVADAIIAAHSG